MRKPKMMFNYDIQMPLFLATLEKELKSSQKLDNVFSYNYYIIYLSVTLAYMMAV